MVDVGNPQMVGHFAKAMPKPIMPSAGQSGRRGYCSIALCGSSLPFTVLDKSDSLIREFSPLTASHLSTNCKYWAKIAVEIQ